MKKLAVYIGRFQPVHSGHLNSISKTLADHAENILILVGSPKEPRNPKNPFTYSERYSMLRSALTSFGEHNEHHHVSQNRIHIRPLPDYIYDEAEWVRNVQREVNNIKEALNATSDDHITDDDITLVGYQKDASSYYLRTFPQWSFTKLPFFPLVEGNGISATKVRELFFEGHIEYLRGVLEPSVVDAMINFSKTDTFEHLAEEYRHYRNYKNAWSGTPFPVIFQTVDSVVLQAGHILLVRRKFNPGKGLWALPGGFVGQDETLEQSMLRELKEETGLRLPKPSLRRMIKDMQVFDAPGRSLRGRTITHAYLIRLDDDKPLVDVRGGDDASDAEWFSLDEFAHMQDQMFEDHWHIVDAMVNRS